MDNLAQSDNFGYMTINRVPNVSYDVVKWTLPNLTINGATKANPFQSIVVPTQTEFETLSMGFLVDEEWVNYLEIFQWMMEIGFDEVKEDDIIDEVSDVSITLLSNNKNPIRRLTYHDAWPSTLGDVEMTSQSDGVEHPICNITFEYSHFSFEDLR